MKEKGKQLCFLIIGLFLFSMVVYGKDYTYYYDELLNDSELVVHTDAELVDSEDMWQFSNIISSYLNRYSISYSDISGTSYGYYVTPNECDQDTLKCNMTLYQSTSKGNKYDSKEIKKYSDVQIKVDDTGVADALSNLVKDNKLVINYDESMFQNEDEKMNYISNYLYNKSVYNKSSYSYFNGLLYYKEMTDNLTTVSYIKRIDEVKFEYEETPFSKEFKELTSDGVITIKTNAELTQELIRVYLNNAYSNSSYFELNGNVVNNKAYVIRYVYNDGEKQEKEKHLVTFKKGELDLEPYKKVGLNDKFEILADKYNNKNAVTNYLSSFNYNMTNEDGTHLNISYVWDMTDVDKVTFKSTLSDSEYKNKKYQYYVMSIIYVGYSKNTSAEYKKLGDKIVVNSNDKSENTINEALGNIEINGYNKSALNCNADFSACDVLIVNYDTKKAENHRMKIEFNDKVSDYFKKAFNLSDDDTIDIVMSDDVNLSSISLYIYNDETNDSYNYYCYNGKCTLTLRNYYEKRSESHKIDLNYIETGKSNYYKNNVVDNKILYPGENKNYFSSLNGANKFSKDKNFYSYANNCDAKKGTCNVYILNENYGIEVHKVNMTIKEGKSPEYEKILPGDIIEVPYVKNDNFDYIYNAISTYLNKKTKSNVYVYSYENDKVQIIYDGLEVHTFNVKFVEADAIAQEAIDKAADNIAKGDKDVVIEDLDLVNSFYYSKEGSLESFDTANTYKKITNIINNKHITYQPLGMGGYGDPFASYLYSNIMLFYDGIGYGLTSDFITYTTRNVIYIPSNTKDTIDEYIKAAQARIDDYLGKDSGVVIQYSEPVDEDYIKNGSIDLTNSDKNVYNLIHKDKIISIVLIKDDSKIAKPNFVTQDVNNNIVIESNNVNYPNDTVVSTYVIGEDTEEFKNIINTLKVNTAQILDISLYSPTVGDITNFDGASFKVTVPITNNELLDKKLVVYYIDEEGKVVSEHPVTVKDGMATFETTHFSTYVLTEKKETVTDNLPEVPMTFDAILMYIIVLGIGIVGMVASIKYLKNKNKMNFNNK